MITLIPRLILSFFLHTVRKQGKSCEEPGTRLLLLHESYCLFRFNIHELYKLLLM